MSSRQKRRSASKSEVLAVDSIFGPPPILPGEDASAYEALLARVSADVKPADVVEKIWVSDIVDLSWEIFRLRRINQGWLHEECAPRFQIISRQMWKTIPTMGQPKD